MNSDNNSCNNSFNNSFNNNHDNSLNFYKIWHNKVILKEIFNHLRLFNIYYKKSYSTKNQYLNDKFRNYVTELTINFGDLLHCGEISNSVVKLKIGGRYSSGSNNKPFNNSIQIGSIPHSVKTLELGERFTQPLKIGFIPSSVTSLRIRSYDGQPLIEGIIPDSVTDLVLDCDFYNENSGSGSNDRSKITIPANFIPSSVVKLEYLKDQLSNGSIPNSVTNLCLGGSFNKPLGYILANLNSISTLILQSFDQTILPNEIPSSVVNLNLKGNFNQPLLPGLIPSSVTTLKLGNYFNKDIHVDSIPNVETIIFGSRFNCMLNGASLPKVKEMILGYDFNKEIKKSSLPSSLETLVFGYSFNQHIDEGVLPRKIHTLIFGDSFNQQLSFCQIPISVKKLVFGLNFQRPFTVLPPFLDTLHLDGLYRNTINPYFIPQHVKTLILGSQPISNGSIPTSTTKLSISFDQSTGKLPTLPDSITDLEIKQKSYCYYIPNEFHTTIPSSVKKLSISVYRPFFNFIIPNSVESLYIDTDQILKPGSISNGLVKSLTFGPSFVQIIQPNFIPPTVQYLTFNNKKMIKSKITKEVLPTSLRVLKISLTQIDLDTFKPIYNHQFKIHNKD